MCSPLPTSKFPGRAMSGNPADEAHWTFAVQLYMSPGVASSCLQLQDHCRVDVNVLLLALFHHGNGGEISADLIESMHNAAADIRELAVLPLREIRKSIKNNPGALRLLGKLRDTVKSLEIDAERIEQQCIVSVLPEPSGGAATTAHEIAKRVAEFYSDKKSADLAVRDLEAIDTIAKAAVAMSDKGPNT